MFFFESSLVEVRAAAWDEMRHHPRCHSRMNLLKESVEWEKPLSDFRFPEMLPRPSHGASLRRHTSNIQEASHPPKPSSKQERCPTHQHCPVCRSQDSNAPQVLIWPVLSSATTLVFCIPTRRTTLKLGGLDSFSRRSTRSLSRKRAVSWSCLSNVSLITTLLDHSATLNFENILTK